MKPDVAYVLRSSAGTLMQRVLPKVDSAHLQGMTMCISLLITAASAEIEHGVAWRQTDIVQMRKLLEEALPHLEPALRQRCVDTLAWQPASLLTSELDRVHALMSDGLIAVQAWAETADGTWASGFQCRVLDHLAEAAQRRRIALG